MRARPLREPCSLPDNNAFFSRARGADFSYKFIWLFILFLVDAGNGRHDFHFGFVEGEVVDRAVRDGGRARRFVEVCHRVLTFFLFKIKKRGGEGERQSV
jgi:hypothetical protein